MSILTTSNLTVGFSSEKTLMKDVDLALKPGDLIGLIGQNGVGKSTLIRTLCGLHPPVSGDIMLDSKPIAQYSPKEIAQKIGLVLTGKPESLNLSVVELVALGRHPYSNWLGMLNNKDKEIIEHSISQMEINYIAQKKLYELSDGQLQKAMIARALAQDTDLIILDEPTSHLDLKNKIEVLNLLKKITENGKGILISTHEIQLSAQVCSAYWCFDFGRPMVSGTTNDLLRKGVVHNYLHLPDNVQIS